MAKKGKNEDVIEWLSRYQGQRKITEELWHEMYFMRAARLKSPDISDMPKGSSGNAGLERYLIVDEEQQRKYTAAVEKQKKLYKEISDAIDAITGENHICILRYRYILGWDWKDIADALDFSVEHAKGKLHGQALEKIKRTHKNTFTCGTV